MKLNENELAEISKPVTCRKNESGQIKKEERVISNGQRRESQIKKTYEYEVIGEVNQRVILGILIQNY